MLEDLASCMLLGPLLGRLKELLGTYEWLAHWRQGEFHHDIVVRAGEGDTALSGKVLVISTNCNGGVKEVLCFAEVPERWALWRERCPENEDFSGEVPEILGRARTAHWFDPCELLKSDARSELRPEHRRRQRGGGWIPLHRDPEA